MTATVILRRRAQPFGIMRRMLVEANGQQVAALAVCRPGSVTVSAGRVELVVRMDWASSAPLVLHLRDQDTV